jgi:NAD(P)-dependent dehydrogenase (short-subunit alcohol dehydrogenase family)
MRQTLALSSYANEIDLLSEHALCRLIGPEEVADLVVFLASERSSAITGAVIPIDAGMTTRTGDILKLPPYRTD